MKVGVVVFPGSNCDHDAYRAFKLVSGVEPIYLWHGSHDLENSDIVVLPGGFSYGDYLRAGAIARFSPIMKKVFDFAHNGGVVLGICNGFQILTESGLLPGALLRNNGLRFVCKEVILRVETDRPLITADIKPGTLLRMPVAHGEGGYFANHSDITRLETSGRILFRYVDSAGAVTSGANPNGSINGIAGIVNEDGNVFGMMPHPERASEAILGSSDGLALIKSLCLQVAGGAVAR
ncbi:MAG TPA: phosphoribosylformylglycinamidine synthase I [candidate division Zixibacteria bacterium]|nr:phosphoribosylformylglycinamidine synthase I [candidate division Zixibacteria bacterium]HBZ01730.1 phosphoribosylformylglycinamidine synthase I [candidate division Zixibacteria bacterium]